MIKHLQINNFQAHAKLGLDLVPGVNTIVGPSDVGKSAILRALRWLAFNKPAGDAFIRNGAATAVVTVVLDHGTTIIRERGKGRNLYCIDGEEYKAFGNDPPAEVAAALNLSDINFQQQHDAPFWFCQTAGEVSRQLNQIVDLGVIDSVLANLAAAMRQAKAEVSVLRSRVEQAKAARDTLRQAPQQDEDLQHLEALSKQLSENRDRQAVLRGLCETIPVLAQQAERSAQQGHACGQAAVRGNVWRGTYAKRMELHNLLVSVRSLSRIAVRKPPSMATVAKAAEAYAAAAERARAVAGLLQQARHAGEASCQASERAKAVVERLQQQMGKVCPLCGQAVKTRS